MASTRHGVDNALINLAFPASPAWHGTLTDKQRVDLLLPSFCNSQKDECECICARVCLSLRSARALKTITDEWCRLMLAINKHIIVFSVFGLLRLPFRNASGPMIVSSWTRAQASANWCVSKIFFWNQHNVKVVHPKSIIQNAHQDRKSFPTARYWPVLPMWMNIFKLHLIRFVTHWNHS